MRTTTLYSYRVIRAASAAHGGRPSARRVGHSEGFDSHLAARRFCRGVACGISHRLTAQSAAKSARGEECDAEVIPDHGAPDQA